MTLARDEYYPAAPLRPVLRTRESAFAYQCAACGRCCRDKLIPVNPYEIARLAAGRGLSTTEFIARFTAEGVALAVRQDGTCIFLEEGGCAVHAQRPLVCRLYPLGVSRAPDGSELFLELEPQPGSEGRPGGAGTVAQYLAAQGAEPYMDASRRYREIVQALVRALAAGDGAMPASQALRASDGAGAPEFLDVDLALARAFPDQPAPDSVEERVARHLEWLRSLVADA